MVSIGDEKSALIGKNPADYCQIVRWLSFANTELLSTLASAFLPLVGRQPYNKKQVETGLAASEKLAALLEERLSEYTYLVGERLSLADLYTASVVGRAFDTIWAKEWMAKHPVIVRWWKTVTASDILTPFYKDFEFRETPVEFVPPKKEKPAKQQKKQEPKPKAAAAAASEEEKPAASEKKEEHPLKSLPKANLVLDEWKRAYSNMETREEALPWFWEHYDPKEYSLWKVAYKYNDELTMTFMSNNLVGGFFNRLSASVKYMFGALVVYGENNNNGIIGAIMVRGDDFAPAFDVAPDWESYDFTKLDPSNPEDKEFVNDLWAWDKPVVIGGESREIADGKVLK